MAGVDFNIAKADPKLRRAVALDELFRAEFPDKPVSKFTDLYPGQEHKLTVALHIRYAYRDRNRRPARNQPRRAWQTRPAR